MVEIRHCRLHDLEPLEWEGALSHDRVIIRDAFARAQRGEMAMLVAESEETIVGQVWIDFVRLPDAAYVWAVRVRRAWRQRGIASRLLEAAERVSADRGFSAVELEVEVANTLAQGLYKRRGYAAIGRNPNSLMVKMRKLLE